MLFHHQLEHNRYELVLPRWVNDSDTPGVSAPPRVEGSTDRDPGPRGEHLSYTQGNGGPPIEVRGLSSFITTKAAAYVFLPSVTAIKFIANL